MHALGMSRAARSRAFVALATIAGIIAASASAAGAVSSDRAIKACLLARRATQPQVVVYGSSRAAKLEPSYLGARVAARAFNTSLSSATPEDVWAFAHLAHDQAGGGAARALWLLDVESFRPQRFDEALLQVPALARYFARSGTAEGPAEPAAPPRAAASCTFHTSAGTRYAADGFRSFDFHDAAAANGTTTADGVRRSIGEYTRLYRRFPRLSPEAEAWTDRTLTALTTWGVNSVIVLTPVHPALLRALGPIGWNRRHAELVAYLHALQARVPFTLIDASRISTFGGKPGGFYDGVHQRVENLRLLISSVVRRSGDALRPAP